MQQVDPRTTQKLIKLFHLLTLDLTRPCKTKVTHTMEKGGGFWTSDNKGWKTRREQQDLYRKALDQQIEERKKMDQQRVKNTKGPTSPPLQISDPVQHLMPWLTNSSTKNNASSDSGTIPPPPSSSIAPQLQMPQQYSSPPVYGTPPPPNQLPPPTNFYYVANPLSPGSKDPQKASLMAPTPNQHSMPIPGPSPPQQPPAGLPSVDQTTPAYTFYGTAPIPPPPAFNSTFYGGYALPQQVTSNPLSPGPTPTYASVPPPPEQVSLPTASPLSGKSKASYWSEHSDFNTESVLEKGVVKHGKVHVSQTSEEVVHSTPSKDEYRRDLERQVEEKKLLEEERQQKAKQEEEHFQKKVQEDQERMEREFKEDLKKVEKKKEDERLRKEAAFRKIEETKQRLMEEKKREAERRRKEMEERQRAITLKEETARNARAGHNTSPTRYYPREEDKAWSWESQPIPVLANRNKSNASLSLNFTSGAGVGSGDASENMMNPSEYSEPTAPPSESFSGKSSGRKDSHNFSEDFHQEYQRPTQPNSPSSTRTYSVSMSELEPQQSNTVPSAGSKSAEEFISSSSVLQGCNDGLMCPKCSRSFSSNDIRLPGTEPERQQIRNFLENISKNLKEERDRLIQSGYRLRR